jgi:starch-binding outer membrane protein, SusD/RagB family
MKYKIFLTIGVVFLAVSSCQKDFLDRKPKGQLTFDTFFQTQDHAIWATNAVYSQLRRWECIAFPFIGATDIMSDDSNKGSSPNDAPYMLELDEFTFDAAHTVPASLWKGYFHEIFLANVAIDGIPRVPTMDETLRKRLIGECKFLRAYSYLLLVQWFGDLPIVTTQLTEDQYFTQVRQPKMVVFAQIEEDLRDAMAVLPLKSKQLSADLGRPTLGSAQALLGKMYMIKHDFVAAEAVLRDLVGSNEYSLTPKYQDIFVRAAENGAESVFEIQAVATPAAVAGPGSTPFNMIQGVRGVPNLGWGFNAPSIELAQSFEPGDPRRRATILAPGEQLPDGSAIVENNPDILDTEERYNKKAWVPTHAGLQDNGPGNIRVFRYADALLLLAEALNENAKTSEALPFLEEIRKRARGTNTFILPAVTTTNQAEFREKIYRERRAELAMEQNRWFDLARWGRTGATMKPLRPNFSENKNELLPIPLAEVDLTAGVLGQNMGW